MINSSTTPSTLQEWSSFVQVLNQKRDSGESLLRSSENPEKLIHHLKQEFERPVFSPSFFLKYKYGKQLILSL